jgi:hypothetical protein
MIRLRESEASEDISNGGVKFWSWSVFRSPNTLPEEQEISLRRAVLA